MKRWWTPTRKGTELFPNASVGPTEVIVQGAPPGPQRDAAVRRYIGRLKQFHGKQQQNYSLMSREQYQTHIEFDAGGRATYINQFGQETLTLTVDIEKIEELLKQQKNFWDYALIELFVPDMHYSENAAQLYCYAHLTIPKEAELTVSSALPFDGVASNVDVRAVADRMLNAAEADDEVRETTGGATEAYASFVVDLRPARGLSAAAVDLYPYVYVGDLLPSATFLVPDDDTDPDTHPIGDYAFVRDNATLGSSAYAYQILHAPEVDGFYLLYKDYAGEVIDVSDTAPWANGVDEIFLEQLPETYFDYSDNLWKFTINHSQLYDELMAEDSYNSVFVPVPPPGHYENQTDPGPWYRHWYIQTSGEPHYYTGPERIPAEVQVTLFQGVPPFDVTEYTGAGPGYHRWTFADSFPNRPGHLTPAQVTVPTFSNTTRLDPSPLLSEFFDIPKLGTVVIPLEIPLGPSWQDA